MEMLLPDWEKKEMNVEKAKEKAQINNLSKFSDNQIHSETCPEGQEEMME